MRPINKIYIHCTAAMWGTLETVRNYHIYGRGWSDIGYHYLIESPYPSKEHIVNDDPVEASDGHVANGRPVEAIGAHVGKVFKDGKVYAGDNAYSIGIALVGGMHGPAGKLALEQEYGPIPRILPTIPFSLRQIRSAIELTRGLIERHHLTVMDIKGHSEHITAQLQGKTCPDMNMDNFRKWVQDDIDSKSLADFFAGKLT